MVLAKPFMVSQQAIERMGELTYWGEDSYKMTVTGGAKVPNARMEHPGIQSEISTAQEDIHHFSLLDNIFNRFI